MRIENETAQSTVEKPKDSKNSAVRMTPQSQTPWCLPVGSQNAQSGVGF